MENQIAKNDRQDDIYRKKNLAGHKTDSSKPYDIINQNYVPNDHGERFAQYEREFEAKRDLRSRRMRALGDSEFNIINGVDKQNGFNKYSPAKPVNDPFDSGAGRPVRSIGARISAGEPLGGKKMIYAPNYGN